MIFSSWVSSRGEKPEVLKRWSGREDLNLFPPLVPNQILDVMEICRVKAIPASHRSHGSGWQMASVTSFRNADACAPSRIL
jgi:hypothetical protein